MTPISVSSARRLVWAATATLVQLPLFLLKATGV